MKREEFVKVAEALDSLPEEFRSRIQNLVILVKDFRRISYQPDSDSVGDCF